MADMADGGTHVIGDTGAADGAKEGPRLEGCWIQQKDVDEQDWVAAETSSGPEGHDGDDTRLSPESTNGSLEFGAPGWQASPTTWPEHEEATLHKPPRPQRFTTEPSPAGSRKGSASAPGSARTPGREAMGPAELQPGCSTGPGSKDRDPALSHAIAELVTTEQDQWMADMANGPRRV